MSVQELKEKYLKTTQENPDFTFFLSSEEILLYILKCPKSKKYQAAASVGAIRHPPIPHCLVNPSLTPAQCTAIWGRYTGSAQGNTSSTRTQLELASWWRSRRKELRDQFGIPANEKVDEVQIQEPQIQEPNQGKEKSKLKDQYLSLLQKHPDVLKYLSSKEIIEGLLQKPPTSSEFREIRELDFRRHPIIPREFINQNLSKRHITKIWGCEALKGGPLKRPPKKTLLEEEKNARQWRKTRAALAKELGIILKGPKIPAPLQGLDMTLINIEEMGRLMGVSAERARQVRDKLGLPKFKPKRTRTKDWIKNHTPEEIANYSMEQLEEILGEKRSIIKTLLRKAKITSAWHPIQNANLRLRAKDLAHIYQANPSLVCKARARTGIAQEENHPDYAKWLEEEEKRANIQLKLWELTDPPKPVIQFPKNIDWSKALSTLKRETGLSISTLHKERCRQGIESDPTKWEPNKGQKNSLKTRTKKLLEENPEAINLPTKEIGKLLGKGDQVSNISNALAKYLNKKEMPKVAELIWPTLEILSRSPQSGEALTSLLATELKIRRSLLKEKISGTKTSRFANLTHHARAVLTKGGHLIKEDGLIQLSERGKTLHETWDKENPPEIAKLLKK